MEERNNVTNEHALYAAVFLAWFQYVLCFVYLIVGLITLETNGASIAIVFFSILCILFGWTIPRNVSGFKKNTRRYRLKSSIKTIISGLFALPINIIVGILLIIALKENK